MKTKLTRWWIKSKYKLIFVCLLLVPLLLGGCGTREANLNRDAETKLPERLAKVMIPKRVGIILSDRDQFSNTLITRALAGIENKVDVEIKYLEQSELASTEDAIRYLAENNYRLLIGLPADYSSAVQRVSSGYPETTFVTFDSESVAKNVLNIEFKEEEGGFLAGALAAQINKTGIVGFLGSKGDDPKAKSYQAGFYQGVAYTNKLLEKNVRINGKFLGFFDKDIKPDRAREIALQQYSSGVDIIFHATGLAAGGVFQSATQTGGLVIGSEINENWKLPGLVPASVVKNFDGGITSIVTAYAQEKLQAGLQVYSLKNNGLRLTDFRNLELEERVGVKNKQPAMDRIIEIKTWVPDEVIVFLQAVRTGISKGTIKVSPVVSQDYIKALTPIPVAVTKPEQSKSQKNQQPSGNGKSIES